MFEIIDQDSVQPQWAGRAADPTSGFVDSTSWSPLATATDCACVGATSPAAVRKVKRCPERQMLTVPPRLHCQRLDDTHWALFDPDGDGGVVVVNQATYELLRTYADGRTAGEQPIEAGSPMAHNDEHDTVQRAAQRLIELGMLIPVGAQREVVSSEPGVLSAWLHITNDCNMRCTYCYIQKTSHAMHRATAQRAVDAVVRSALLHGYREVRLKYAGGEPTLRMAQVLDVHDYAADRCAQAGLSLSATLLSNGSLLAQSTIEEIRRRNIHVMISLDGIGSDHDFQRPLRNGRPSFGLVKQGIERLLAAGVRPHISITLTAHNCSSAAEAVSLALANDCTFALNLYRASASVADRDSLRMEQQAVIAACERVFQLLDVQVPQWSVLGAVLDRGHLLAPHEYAACGVGKDYMVIDHQGRIAKCQMEIENTLTDVADVDPLGTIRLSPRGVQNPPAAEKEGCRTCPWQRWCAGGCPLMTYEASGRYDVQSPYCDVYQAIYPMAIRAEGMRLLQYGHSLLTQ